MRNSYVALIFLLTIVPITAIADGKQLYDSLCQTCHGPEGLGDGEGLPESLIKPRPFTKKAFKFDTDADWQKGTDQDIANVIMNGTAAYGGSTARLCGPMGAGTGGAVSKAVKRRQASRSEGMARRRGR